MSTRKRGQQTGFMGEDLGLVSAEARNNAATHYITDFASALFNNKSFKEKVPDEAARKQAAAAIMGDALQAIEDRNTNAPKIAEGLLQDSRYNLNIDEATAKKITGEVGKDVFYGKYLERSLNKGDKPFVLDQQAADRLNQFGTGEYKDAKDNHIRTDVGKAPTLFHDDSGKMAVTKAAGIVEAAWKKQDLSKPVDGTLLQAKDHAGILSTMYQMENLEKAKKGGPAYDQAEAALSEELKSMPKYGQLMEMAKNPKEWASTKAKLEKSVLDGAKHALGTGIAGDKTPEFKDFLQDAGDRAARQPNNRIVGVQLPKLFEGLHKGDVLKPGEDDPRVGEIRNRLTQLAETDPPFKKALTERGLLKETGEGANKKTEFTFGPDPAKADSFNRYDPQLQAAMKAFQGSRGLKEDGKPGAHTAVQLAGASAFDDGRSYQHEGKPVFQQVFKGQFERERTQKVAEEAKAQLTPVQGGTQTKGPQDDSSTLKPPVPSQSHRPNTHGRPM